VAGEKKEEKKRRSREEKQKLGPLGELFNRQGRKKENFKRYSLKYILKSLTVHGARARRTIFFIRGSSFNLCNPCFQDNPG